MEELKAKNKFSLSVAKLRQSEALILLQKMCRCS